MRVFRTCLGLAACVLMLGSTSAMARQLTIVSIAPLNLACIFTPKCAVTITDTTGYIQMSATGGYGSLLVRTYPGLPGTRAAGLTGYSMFLDMHKAMALGTPNCVTKLTVDTGPIESVYYTNTTAEVFVVGTSGGAGVASATQTGSKVTFTFAKPICPSPGTMTESLYFGFAAKGAPKPAKAEVTGSVQGTAMVDVRVPQH